jgi:glycosyltransferase involved in cell wall biosynthesis
VVRRVLFLIPNLGGGGAQRVITTLLTKLDRSAFEPMLGLVDRSRDAFADQLPGDVRIVDLPGPRVRNALPEIVKLIWRERPHLVLSTLDHLNMALAASRPFWPGGVKCALRMTYTGSLVSWPNRLAMSALYRSADVLIYQSEAMAGVFRGRLMLGGTPSVVLANPVDVETVRRRAGEAGADPGYDPGAFNFIAVGRLDHSKGFDLAIDALAELGDRQATLTILGEGSALAELTAQVRDKGLQDRVRLLGFKANPYPFMRQADALVLSSRFEGFPNVVLEGLALGVPVVAAPVPGVPELLRDIASCEVASATDAPSLAEAMSRILGRGRVRVAEGVVSRYDADAATRNYEALFHQLIEGSSVSPLG